MVPRYLDVLSKEYEQVPADPAKPRRHKAAWEVCRPRSELRIDTDPTRRRYARKASSKVVVSMPPFAAEVSRELTCSQA